MEPSEAVFETGITSKPITFVVGEQKKEFFVHKYLIRNLSPVLALLVDGPMQEAVEGRVEWPGVDVDTFSRFARFIYTSNYHEAEPEVVEENGSPSALGKGLRDASPEAQGGPEEAGDFSDRGAMTPDSNDSDEGVEGPGISDYQLPYSVNGYLEDYDNQIEKLRSQHLQDYHQPTTDHRKIKRRRVDNDTFTRYCSADGTSCTFPGPDGPKSRAARRFHDRKERFDQGMMEADSARWSPYYNTDVHACFAPVFLSHAKLYILADKYDIRDLRRLALWRLWNTLLFYSVYPERIDDLVGLTKTLYENTVEDDEARVTMADFWAVFIENVSSLDDLKGLLRRQGDFAADLMGALTTRLVKSSS